MVKFYRFLIFAIAGLFSVQVSLSQTVVTPAPAQTSICVGSGYVTLGTIYIAETNFANFNNGNNQSYIMSVPANFEFNTGATPSITANAGSGVSGINVQSLTATTLTFQYNVSVGSTSSGPLDSIIITGLQVRAVTAASTGSIARSGGTAIMNGNGAADGQVHCALTSVTGATITSQPSDQAVCEDDDPTFSVTATGTGLTYQWRRHNGTSWGDAPAGFYGGTTTPTLSITDFDSGTLDGFLFTCIVTGSCGPVSSDTAELTLDDNVSVTSHPVDVLTCDGTTIQFSVTGAGSAPLTYAWQRHNGTSWNSPPGGTYSGINTNTISVDASEPGHDDFLFRCTVTNRCGVSVTSNQARLDVLYPVNITTQPSNQSTCISGNTSFSVVASNALSYQWQVNDGGGFVNATGGVYSNGTTSTLNINGATAGMNGYTYRCIVTGCNTVNSSTRTLTINSAPTVNTHPGNQSTCDGGNTSFTVSATGATGYQWQVNTGSGFNNVSGVVYSGGTSATLSITGATLAMSTYQYRCVVSSSCGSVNSNNATLTVNNSAPATFFGLTTSYCRNGAVDTLEAFPTGGTFSGTGIGATNVATGKAPFDPKVGGLGGRTITYTYGCTVVNKNTTINDTTNIAYTSPIGSPVYAATDPSVDLVVEEVPPAGPLPGTYSGDGVYQSRFYPNLAGPGGPYPVNFSFTNTNGCSSTKSINISVIDNSGTPIPPLQTGPYCPGGTPILLDPNSLTIDPLFLTGWYEFAGYDGSPDLSTTNDTVYTFTPATPGTYTINYKVRNRTFIFSGGTFSFGWVTQVHASQTVTVSSTTSVDFTLPATACNTESGISMNPFPGIASGGPGTGFSIVSPASPPAGILSGTGNSTFNPNVVTTETTFTVRYTYINASGCSGVIDKVITVIPKPTPPSIFVFPSIYGTQHSTYCYEQSRKPLRVVTNSGFSYSWYNDPALTLASKISDNFILPVQSDDSDPGTYNYYITRTYSGCTSDPLTTSVTINDYPVVDAGSSQTICEGSTVTLNGSCNLKINTSTAVDATWQSLTGGTFDDPNDLDATYTPSADDISNEEVELYLVSDDYDGAGPCPNHTKTVKIKINEAATIYAGQDTTFCSSSLIRLDGTKGGSAGDVEWTGGLNSITGATTLNASYTPHTSEKLGATITFRLTAADPDDIVGPCPSVYDEVNVTISQEVVVNAGANQTICEGNTATLNGSSSLLVSGAPIAATWTSATGGTFDNAGSLTAVYTPSATDITNRYADLTLTSDDPDGSGNSAPCPAKLATTKIIINPSATVSAGQDSTYCSSEQIFLQGSFGGSAQSITWTGGTPGRIQNAVALITKYNATDTEKSGQTIIFTLKTDDPDGAGPCEAATDDVQIEINQEAFANAGSDQALCRSVGTTVFNLDGETKYMHNDDPLNGTWSGGLGVFSNDTDPEATYTPHMSEIPADGALQNTVKLYFTSDEPDGSGPCPVIKDSIILTINPLPRIDSVKVIDTSFCTSDNAFQITTVMESQYPRLTDGFTDLPGGNQGVTGTFFAPQIATIGEHTLRYTFTDINGCSNFRDTLIHVYGVPKPKIAIANYCATRETDFDGTLSDISFDSESSINYYKWNFGDFLTEDDTARTVSANYIYSKTLNAAARQAYTVKLIVGTDKGCFGQKDSTITIGNIPATNFSWSGICPVDVTEFVDLSSFPSEEVSQYTWNFGDGSGILNGPGMVGVTPNLALKNPDHQMANGTGPYNVSYTISSIRGCDSTMIHRVDILDQYQPTPSDPYATNFATDNAFWAVDGFKSSWQWGPSAKTLINSAGRRIWITDTLDTYNPNENSHLNGPCLNMTDLIKPMISMKIKSATQNQFAGAVLQASIDGGGTWNVVGALGDGVNWYDNFGVQGSPGGQLINQYGWTGEYTDWKIAKISLNTLSGQPSVRLRVAFGAGADSLNLKDGFALDSVWVGERDKFLLIENFTNSASGLVSANDAAMNALVDSRPNDVVAIHYHTSFPGADPMNVRNPADPSSRVLQYGVPSVPYKVFEGNYNYVSVDDPGLTTKDIDRRSLESAKFKIKIKTEVVGLDSVNVKAQVFAADSTNRDIVVHIAVLEKEATPPSLGTWRWVLAKMLPDAAGTYFSQNFQKGDSIYIQQAWNFVAGTDVYDPAQLGFVVFVQDALSKEVYQTAYVLGTGGSITGLKHQTLNGKDVFVYPNPANEQVNLLFEPSDKEYTYQVYDEFGRVVDNGVVERGRTEIGINTSGLAAGLYVVRIGNSEDGWAFKKVVVAH